MKLRLGPMGRPLRRLRHTIQKNRDLAERHANILRREVWRQDAKRTARILIDLTHAITPEQRRGIDEFLADLLGARPHEPEDLN